MKNTHKKQSLDPAQILLNTHSLVAGCDEAGAGCGAGDLVVASVVLDPHHSIKGLTDSKLLSEKKREELFPLILEHCLEYTIVHVPPKRIDDINILQARMEGFAQCIGNMKLAQCAIIDGNKMPPNLPLPTATMVKADLHLACVSAASVLAKVTRDRLMVQMDRMYPKYGFAKHKGYLTKVHLEALKNFGPCAIHRMSYAPVRDCKRPAKITDFGAFS